MIYTLITAIILFYAVYMLLTVSFGMFYTSPKMDVNEKTTSTHKTLVFYPVYKPGKEVVEIIKKQREELEGLNAHIYVLSQETEDEINNDLVAVADFIDREKFSQLSGNSYHYALQYAVNRINDFGSFDSILLLDPDNFIDVTSIRRLITSRITGNQVALSRRTSYRQEGSTSLFDGLSERLNDYMFRRAKVMLGFIPELSGSGMMMDTQVFTQAVHKLDRKAPGMDKQLLINMMLSNQNLSISYDEKAVVYDEKTEDQSQFGRQRLRWFGNQYYNAKKFGLTLMKSSNLAHVDYGIALCRPPRSFQVIGTLLLLPFDLAAYYLGWISLPIISISALVAFLAILLFLWKERVVIKVLRQAGPIVLTALKNGLLATKSVKKENEGVFIHTRSE